MDPEKVWAVLEWVYPLNQETITQLPGICQLLLAVHPLICLDSPPHHHLAKKERWGQTKTQPTSVNWIMKCQAVFKKLKRLFSTEPVLKTLKSWENFCHPG